MNHSTSMGSGGTAPRYRRVKDRAGPLSTATKIIYAVGEMPGSHMNFAIGSFLLLYYNQILGVNATTISIVMGGALLLDAVTDPLVGAWSDRFTSRLGRRHPFMYAAALPLGIFLFLLFSPPDGLGESGLILWISAFLILTRLTFTVFSVPWSALMPELAPTFDERTSLSAWRQLVGHILGGVFGMLVFLLVFPAVEGHEQGQLNPDHYPRFAVVIGFLATFWSLLTTHFSRGEIPHLLQPVVAERTHLKDMLNEILLALGSRNYRLLLGAALIYFGVVSTLAVFDMLVNTYFWRLTGEQLSLLALVIVTGPVLAFLSAARIQQRFERKQVLCGALLLQMLLSLLTVGARLSGLFPENESAFFLPLIAVFTALQAFVMVLGAIALLSMIADLVDEQEHRTGRRQDGVFASGIALATKAVGSVGVVVGGLMVDHFVGLAPGQAGHVVADDVIWRLAIADAVIVNALILVPAWLVSRYDLTTASLATIHRDLAARRASGTEVRPRSGER